MNKLLLSVLCVLALFAAVASCVADTVNGVLAEERVVNLPNDSGKWYVSVVGNVNDARYREVLGWFDTYPGLAKAKSQVHFCPVASDTALYKERYAGNVNRSETRGTRVDAPDRSWSSSPLPGAARASATNHWFSRSRQPASRSVSTTSTSRLTSQGSTASPLCPPTSTTSAAGRWCV